MPILSGVGASGSVGPTSGGKVYAWNNITTVPFIVAKANPARTKITFHNPGSVDIYIAPQFVQTTGTNSALAPTPSALAGCILVFANGGSLTIEGECQGAWQAFAPSGTSNALTVIDSNI